MARNQIHIDVPPGRVFQVLEEPENYAYWVVGSKDVRDADPNWPQEGSKFHHTIGMGPFELKDNTEVEQVERDRHLVLRTRTRPAGVQRVALELDPEGDGTRVTMRERPVSPALSKLFNLPADLLLRGRNAESLRRLKEIAERR
ncbi:MAG TPA: SRPBCC family protein [Candidatus Caenarcaniphilales bacterium]|nr:SRPBCC family protein [Candidatus Caenarcaniphilales bacterium]